MPLSLQESTDAPPGWAELARQHGVFYHQPEWIAGVGHCFGYRVYYLTAGESGLLQGGLALAEVPGPLGGIRLVSFPFGYAAGPVARNPAAASMVLAAAVQLASRRKARRLEVKQLEPRGEPAPGFIRTARYASYRVQTDGGEAALWQRLNADSTRRGIRKAEKAGVVIVRAAKPDDWVVFSRLEDVTARGHGMPAPPRRFFEVFCRELQQSGLAELYLAQLRDGRVAAGIVVWKGPREWIYAFNASDPSTLGDRPNHALLWAALRDAAAAGVTLDLGRAAQEQQSLIEYKLRWGGQPVPLAYDYWPTAAGLNVARRDGGALGLAASIWRRLPLPITRAGSGLYRYLG